MTTTYLDLPTYQRRSDLEVTEIKAGLHNGVLLSLLLWTAIVLALVLKLAL